MVRGIPICICLSAALSFACAVTSSTDDGPTNEPVLSEKSSPITYPGTIRVYFHVIYAADGNVPTSQINSQMNVLNTAFAPGGWTFQLGGVDRTYSPSWYDLSQHSSEERAMKQALRRGSEYDLNVYTASLSGGLLEWASYPWDYTLDPEDDGVVLNFATLPGGTAAPYNLGDTLVHATGHWMGLLHTFENGCTATGDGVDDTPPHVTPTFGCPSAPWPDTCPRWPGLDPVRNYMNFADDACMNQFTPGQFTRMAHMMSVYR